MGEGRLGAFTGQGCSRCGGPLCKWVEDGKVSGLVCSWCSHKYDLNKEGQHEMDSD